MVTNVIALALVLAVSFLSTSPASAASSASQKDLYSTSGSFSLTPVAGILTYSGSGPHLSGPLFGIKFGYEASGKTVLDSFGTEGTLAYFSAKPDKGNNSTSGYLFRIEETLPFTINQRLVPFAAVGAGGIIISSDSSTKGLPFFTYGAGVKYFFRNDLAVRADVRHILALTINGLDNFELTAGLTYYFGKEGKKKVVPIPEVKPPEKETKEKETKKREPETKKKEPAPEKEPAKTENGPEKGSQPSIPTLKPESELSDAAPESAPARGLSKVRKPIESPEKPAVGLDRSDVKPEAVPVPDEKPREKDSTEKETAPETPLPKTKKDSRSVPPISLETTHGKLPETAPDTVPSRGSKKAGAPVISREKHAIQFDFDKYDVKPEYFGQIKEIADTLRSIPASTAVIEGHTDIIGTRRYNLKLSQRRAQSVKDLLVKFGIGPRRISIKGLGPSRPIADNKTIEGRQKNRRALEVIIVDH